MSPGTTHPHSICHCGPSYGPLVPQSQVSENRPLVGENSKNKLPTRFKTINQTSLPSKPFCCSESTSISSDLGNPSTKLSSHSNMTTVPLSNPSGNIMLSELHEFSSVLNDIKNTLHQINESLKICSSIPSKIDILFEKFNESTKNSTPNQTTEKKPKNNKSSPRKKDMETPITTISVPLTPDSQKIVSDWHFDSFLYYNTIAKCCT